MRKTLIALGAVLALAVGAAPAQAHHMFGHTQIEVVDTASGEPCPELSVNGNTVTGGCLVEDVYGYFWTEYERYDVETDLRVDAEGNLYAVNPYIHLGQQFSQRQPCTDDVSGELIPWYSEAPIGVWFGGAPAFDLNMCIEKRPEGYWDTWDQVPYDISGTEPGDFGVVTGFEQNGVSQKDIIKYSTYTVPNGEITIPEP